MLRFNRNHRPKLDASSSQEITVSDTFDGDIEEFSETRNKLDATILDAEESVNIILSMRLHHLLTAALVTFLPATLLAESPFAPFAGAYKGTETIQNSLGANTIKTGVIQFFVDASRGIVTTHVRGSFQTLIFLRGSPFDYREGDGNVWYNGVGTWKAVQQTFIRFTANVEAGRYVKGQIRRVGDLLIISVTEYYIDSSWNKRIYRLKQIGS